jgi:hypothetical protein
VFLRFSEKTNATINKRGYNASSVPFLSMEGFLPFPFFLSAITLVAKSRHSVSSLALSVARTRSRMINRRREMLPNAIRCLHG